MIDETKNYKILLFRMIDDLIKLYIDEYDATISQRGKFRVRDQSDSTVYNMTVNLYEGSSTICTFALEDCSIHNIGDLELLNSTKKTLYENVWDIFFSKFI